MATRAELRRQRDDALMRAEHAEREAARLHLLNIALTEPLTFEEYGQIGGQPDGAS